MKLVYFYCGCIPGPDSAGIVSKTRHGARAEREARGEENFLTPVRKTIIYNDAFHLMEMLTSAEGGRGFSNA